MDIIKVTPWMLVLIISLGAPLTNSALRFNQLNQFQNRDVNGGGDCAGCTLLFTLLSHIKQYNNVTSAEALPILCSYLPGIFNSACSRAEAEHGAIIAEQLDSGDNADVICHGLQFCYTEPGLDVCHLLPEPNDGFQKAMEASIKRNQNLVQDKNEGGGRLEICAIPEFVDLCIHVEHALSFHEPVFDDDGDNFSTVDVLRGYNWRGIDNNDNDTAAHPGRIPLNEDRDFDSNGNGIWGVNPISGVPYETELCKDSEPRGIIFFGDSAGAHFHFPPEFMDVTRYSAEIFSNLTYVIENELDWPELSFGTGHANKTWDILLNVSTNSLYSKLRNRNLCNNNDYHNRAYNGGRSSNILSHINFNTTRNRETDYPALVIYAELANDVCNGHNDTIDHMTPVDEFQENVLTFLAIMDQVLPAGSHILLLGLLNGELLRPVMSEHLHPLGYLNSDITYELFYDYLNCLLVTPCLGWTSDDESLRNATTERATQMSEILEEIANTESYNNFDLRYFRIPLKMLYEEIADDFYKFVEPADGFHPNRRMQTFFAEVVWNHIETHFPDFIGQENPNNVLIHSLFGL